MLHRKPTAHTLSGDTAILQVEGLQHTFLLAMVPLAEHRDLTHSDKASCAMPSKIDFCKWNITRNSTIHGENTCIADQDRRERTQVQKIDKHNTHTHTPHVHCTHVYTKVREYRCLALRTAEWWDKDDNANSHKDMLRYMQGSACCTNIDAAVEFREAEKGPPDCGVPHVVHVNCCHPLPFPPPPPPSSPSLRPSPSSCVTLLHITQKTMVTTINHGLLLSTV